MKRMSVTLEVSKLSGWLKASARCRVQRGRPSEGDACVARRCGTEERANQQRTRRACVAQLGSAGIRRRRKRTSNIRRMSVTLEVFQLEMSALKLCRFIKSPLMSLMAETSQSAMGPYVPMVSFGFASYAWTAVSREALVVKVRGVAIHRSTGSHCGGQATPRAEGRVFELRWPMTCG